MTDNARTQTVLVSGGSAESAGQCAWRSHPLVHVKSSSTMSAMNWRPRRPGPLLNRAAPNASWHGRICSIPSQVGSLFQTVRERAGVLDVFVHCAALGSFKPTLEIKPNQWDLTMNIGARAFLLCVQQCPSVMRKGSIIALSSLGSLRVTPNYGAMGATKSALESLVRYLAVELAPRGIRVNAVSGGFVETDSMKSFPQFETFSREIAERTPAGRIAQPGRSCQRRDVSGRSRVGLDLWPDHHRRWWSLSTMTRPGGLP